MKTAFVVSLSVLLGACTTLHRAPNDYEVAAAKLVGQPAAKAALLFGPPSQGAPPSGGGGYYVWEPTRVFINTELEFVAEPTEAHKQDTNQTTNSLTAAAKPIPSSQEASAKQTTYLCGLTVFTNAQNTITQTTTSQCHLASHRI